MEITWAQIFGGNYTATINGIKWELSYRQSPGLPHWIVYKNDVKMGRVSSLENGKIWANLHSDLLPAE